MHPIKIIQKLYLLAIGQAIIVDARSFHTLQNKAEQFDEIQKMRPPVFIFGPPRSGSTYLVEAMNTHEMIFVTNEFRVMSFVNDLFRLFLYKVPWQCHQIHNR